MVGDSQRIAVASIAELELAFEVGTPQVIGRSTARTAACRARDGAGSRRV